MCITIHELHAYIAAVSNRLNANRPYLCSESDLQSQLVYEIQKDKPNLIIISDSPYMVGNKVRYIDLRVIDPITKNLCLIELKFASIPVLDSKKGLLQQLRAHNWVDKGRVAFICDIKRLEDYDTQCKFTVFLTNDPRYWDLQNQKVNDANYHLNQFDSLGQQRTITGKLNWGIHPPSKWTFKYKIPISLRGNYPLVWHYFTQDPLFKYLLLEVN